MILASAAGGPNAFDANPAASLAAIACAVLAGLGLLVVVRSRRLTRIQPAGATMDLHPETPALVDFLTGGFEVEDDAVPATVVHLASRGWFSIEDYGDQTIIRTRSTRPTNDQLTPYEQRVLDHVEHHAIDGTLPTLVLTLGVDGMSKRWFHGFSNQVVRHAHQLGLSVNRFGWQHHVVAWGLVAVAALPAIFVADAAETADDTAKWVSLGNILLGLAFVVAGLVALIAVRTVRIGAQRDTPAGASAAAHWMGVRDFYRNAGEFANKSAASVAIWDEHLAYATALGLAQTVQRQIPFETESDTHAWSRATGRWRRVKVRYRTLRPGWGRHPLWMALGGFMAGLFWGAVAYGGYWVASGRQWRPPDIEFAESTERWISLVATIVTVLAIALAGAGAARLCLAAVDVFRRRTVEGELVRRRSRGGGDDSEPRYYLAIDTATAQGPRDPERIDSILAYRVRPEIYAQTAQGARLRLLVTPLLGYVKSVDTLAPAPRLASLADDTGAAGEVIGRALEGAAGAWSGAVGGWLSRRAAAAGGIDAATRAQMEDLLRDPQVADSPGGRFMQRFLGTDVSDRVDPADSP